MNVVQVVRNGILVDELQPRTDRLYANFTVHSHLLPAERPWLYRVGDLVRVGDELVQILDGFLHVRRACGSRYFLDSAPAGSSLVIVASACAEGSSL